ncbi:MAG: FecR domain-containing protein [bacterium]|nr:FecR domain-containing protein [bacterium]
MKTHAFVVPAMLLGALALALPVRAANDKELQNMKGSVSYARPSAAAKPLAPNAEIVLGDRDVAITGAASLAGVTLPDSSQVLVGSESRVELGFFKQTEIANAKFVVYDGKVRFTVRHPQGARANYIFTTPTASVAVRGTQGDIESSGSDVRVNVYEVCDPSEPVTVTTKDGASYQLNAGQSLVAQVVGGIVRAKVEALSQQLIDQFSPDFGAPTSWDAAKGEVVGMAQSQASSALDSATGGYGSQVAGALGGLFGHKKSTPTPSPTPQSASCTH